MNLLIKELNNYPANDCEISYLNTFGAFKVKEFKNNQLIKCFTLKNHTESINFFNKFINVIKDDKKNEELFSQIKHYVDYIKYRYKLN